MPETHFPRQPLNIINENATPDKFGYPPFKPNKK